MTELPEIDPNKVTEQLANKLANENLELRKQVVTLEMLATALRDERDAARTELGSE